LRFDLKATQVHKHNKKIVLPFMGSCVSSAALQKEELQALVEQVTHPRVELHCYMHWTVPRELSAFAKAALPADGVAGARARASANDKNASPTVAEPSPTAKVQALDVKAVFRQICEQMQT